MDIKRLYRQASFAVIALAGISVLIEPKRLPISIILGAVLGLLNLKGLSWGIDSLLHSYRATTKLVILSLLRLNLLFAVIVLLAVLRLINLLGLMIGFTVVFVLLLREGLRVSKEDS